MTSRARLLSAFVASLAAVALAACNPLSRPSVAPYAPLMEAGSPKGKFEAYFLGASTLVFSDGATRIMIDGFFSRPGLGGILLPIEPNPTLVRDGLALAMPTNGKVDAIFVAHAHHDHVMDSALVAHRTGAILLGSLSVANVARGANFPRERICVIERRGGRFGLPALGRFTVTAVKTPHAPTIPFEGEINEPLKRPAWIHRFKEGGNHSFLIEHPGGDGEPPRKILVVTSGGFESGLFDGLPDDIDIVFLAIGKLGRQEPEYVAAYWEAAVKARGAKTAILIHWDDIRVPLTRNGEVQDFKAIFRAQDDLHEGMRQIMPMANRDGVKLHLPKRAGRVEAEPLARSGQGSRQGSADGQRRVAPEAPCLHPEL